MINPLGPTSFTRTYPFGYTGKTVLFLGGEGPDIGWNLSVSQTVSQGRIGDGPWKRVLCVWGCYPPSERTNRKWFEGKKKLN